jgi:hypothetical protein
MLTAALKKKLVAQKKEARKAANATARKNASKGIRKAKKG